MCGLWKINQQTRSQPDLRRVFCRKNGAAASDVEDLYFDRTPIATENIEKIHQPKHELLHVLASMQDDVKDMQRLSALYAEYLPKQARWQAELLALGIEPVTNRAMQRLPILRSPRRRCIKLLFRPNEMQNTVDQQLAAIPTVVDRQREAATADLEKMLTVALAQIRAEREAVMQAVHQEQLAIREWVQLTADASADRADVITQKRITQSAGAAQLLLDRAAFYGGTFLGIAGFLGFLFFAWFRILHRRHSDKSRGFASKQGRNCGLCNMRNRIALRDALHNFMLIASDFFWSHWGEPPLHQCRDVSLVSGFR